MMEEMQREALITANEYLFTLKAGIENAVSFFEQGEYGKGCEVIPLIADGIEYISEIVGLTKNILGEDLETRELNQFLGEIVEAIENEDFVLVGDLFNYEVLPILENYHDTIKKVVLN